MDELPDVEPRVRSADSRLLLVWVERILLNDDDMTNAGSVR